MQQKSHFITINLCFVSTAGFLLVLMVYCIYHRPDYHSDSYIKFTQNLHASKAYKIVAFCIFVVSVIIIIIGIHLLIKYDKDWTQYIVAINFDGDGLKRVKRVMA